MNAIPRLLPEMTPASDCSPQPGLSPREPWVWAVAWHRCSRVPVGLSVLTAPPPACPVVRTPALTLTSTLATGEFTGPLGSVWGLFQPRFLGP